MDLFSDVSSEPIQLLPYNGEVLYFGPVVDTAASDSYLAKLLRTVDWKNDHTVMFGKKIVTKRKVAWCADQPFPYRYSGTTKLADPWTTDLIELKALAETITAETYNSCLLNLYHTGDEGMSWHRDAEKELKKDGAIASLSFGDKRKFSFKHKLSKETLSVTLEHGSLLLMRGVTQQYWLHQLPKTKKSIEPRINLTFRTIDSR